MEPNSIQVWRKQAHHLLFLLLLFLRWLAPAADRPNILWLVSEDNTTLLGCYGDPLARTPTLDKLAREGVLFERCSAQPVNEMRAEPRFAPVLARRTALRQIRYAPPQ